MYELTLFKNQFDNKTHRRTTFMSWMDFVVCLRDSYTKPGEKGGSNSSPLLTPAVFDVGTTRSNRSVLYWSPWCCVDVDDPIDGCTNVESLRTWLHRKYGQYDYVVYNTASSTEEHLKFRIIFRLDEQIENNRIKAFWHALNTELGELGDPQTKDLARMYYVPAQYPNAYSFFMVNSGGNPMNASELIAKHPYHEKTNNTFLDRLSPEMRAAVIQYRKDGLNNTDYRWSSYRDCPFWPRKLGAQYMQITDSGWYFKMYKIMIAIAGNAYSKGYPITANQIADLCREFDLETGNWYENRPLTAEADRALEYIYRNG
jgi:hypothetical protein